MARKSCAWHEFQFLKSKVMLPHRIAARLRVIKENVNHTERGGAFTVSYLQTRSTGFFFFVMTLNCFLLIQIICRSTKEVTSCCPINPLRSSWRSTLHHQQQQKVTENRLGILGPVTDAVLVHSPDLCAGVWFLAGCTWHKQPVEAVWDVANIQLSEKKKKLWFSVLLFFLFWWGSNKI